MLQTSKPCVKESFKPKQRIDVNKNVYFIIKPSSRTNGRESTDANTSEKTCAENSSSPSFTFLMSLTIKICPWFKSDKFPEMTFFTDSILEVLLFDSRTSLGIASRTERSSLLMYQDVLKAADPFQALERFPPVLHSLRYKDSIGLKDLQVSIYRGTPSTNILSSLCLPQQFR